MKTIAQFGIRSVMPHRRGGETWQTCFQRECIDEVPAPWIAERASAVSRAILSAHHHHASTPLPESRNCVQCSGILGSWRSLATTLYNGDPFGLKTMNIGGIKAIEPEFFRAGSGKWGGSPTWT